MDRTIVVGLGRSGIGAARLLHHNGIPVSVMERGNTPQDEERAAPLRQQGIEVTLGLPLEPESFQPWHGCFDTVVIGPGIAWDHPTLHSLRSQGIRVRGEMDLAWQALRHLPWVGITGTNGKTTVTHLLSHVLECAGLRAPMGGNMGVSAAEMALQLKQASGPEPDWMVMELSSYQIEATPELAPRIGLWTTLTPDHLERHGTLEAYRAIKRGLLERSDLAIFNADDPDLRQQRGSWQPRGIWVSAAGPRPDGQDADLWIDADDQVRAADGPLFPATALAMPGLHNRQNLLMVTAAARRIGLPAAEIEAALRRFPGVPHRLERLGTVNGLSVFNDSKATNYDAAEVGLRAMTAPVVVLAGGETKRGEAAGWLKQLKQRACAVVLFGAGAEELQTLIDASGFPGVLHRCQDLPEAVPLALAEGCRLKAASLLLSPACASFDQYTDFEARGDHFRQLIQASSGLN
ncbi:UDP-N-acetylmuramoylalanine--D-glutamate ligase [Synechococcus sp. A15-127]|uniref:UDP-N-acetylmuramoyl-L-alanine--D-glutamate ligase n=1 Tax=Synechococcus sp. A15-127 TaxID=1050624 RepID=UPI001645B132|nr:UDP-N-acetylmuramoyl-L-alanine--D-glutamate ligase [Synechococcus sp. A15-127]QNI95342.1 UDP-N-acetylmuramoylalanine--D-glutamate ligase [Synechococcus sp. A15-127]